MKILTERGYSFTTTAERDWLNISSIFIRHHWSYVQDSSLEKLVLEGLLFLFFDGLVDVALVHELSADFENDEGCFFCKEEALAELTSIIHLIEKSGNLAYAHSSLNGDITVFLHWAGFSVGVAGILAILHVLHHHFHGLCHVDVGLHLGSDFDGGARVVFKLILTSEEHASLGTTHELRVPCIDRSHGSEGGDCSKCFHFWYYFRVSFFFLIPH